MAAGGGSCPFAWAILGGLAQATERLRLMTAVTCPIMRFHPAIVAQAAATLGVMSDGRFSLGLGAGERLNEHVVAAGWPGIVERHERLGEALDIIQGLLAGKITSYRGRHLQLDHAKLFDRPAHKPAVIVAAGGPEAARLAAEKADGLVVTEVKKEIVQAWRKAGGKGPGRDEKAAIKMAHKYFRWSVAGWPVLAELPHEEAFEAALKHISAETMAEEISCGPRPTNI